MNKKGLHNQGFTIIEVMVALIIATIIFVAVPPPNEDNDRRIMEQAVDDIDRSVRFSSNESVLKNSVIRLKIEMDVTPNEYSAELAPKGNFKLLQDVEERKLSLKEAKIQEEKVKKFNQGFQPIAEFSDKKREIPDRVKIIGYSTSTLKSLIQEGDAYLYFYPSGERDSAIIFFATQAEVGSLEIFGFRNKTEVNYYELKEEDIIEDGITDVQYRIMEEVYQEWRTK